MDPTTEAPTRRYEGSCHCGALRFRFRNPELTTGVRCNCSICVRRGAVMSSRYVPPEDFEQLEGREALAVYRFGDHCMNHYFCRTCGIAPFSEVIERPGHLRLNLGCVEGVDPLSLEVTPIDGRSY